MIDFRECSYNLDLDLLDYSFMPRIYMKQHDAKSRYIKARIYRDGLDFNITDKDLSFKVIFKKPDNTVVFRNCDVVVDGQDKYVLIPVDDNTLAVPGKITSELVIMQNDEIYSSKYFYISCLPSLHADKGQIESADDYQGLLDTIIKAEELIKDLEKLDTLVVLHHVVEVQADTNQISFANWAEYVDGNAVEVFLSGVKLIEGIDFTIDTTAKTITGINPKTFIPGDQVLLCGFRRMIGPTKDIAITANRVALTREVRGADNVQNALEALDGAIAANTTSINNTNINITNITNRLDKELAEIKTNCENTKKEIERIDFDIADINREVTNVKNTALFNSDEIADIKTRLDDLESGNRNYLFDIDGKPVNNYKKGLTLGNTTVMQCFDIDHGNNFIYTSQVLGSQALGNVLLCKIDASNNKIVGKMTLNGFGHGYNFCIEERGRDTYIWIESDGVVDSSNRSFGTKISRFKFEDGKTYTGTAGDTYDLVPGKTGVAPAIDVLNNHLLVKSSGGGRWYTVFDLQSVINKKPVQISQFKMPNSINVMSHQGFDIHKGYIYNFEGLGSDATNPSTAYLSVLDLKGNLIYRKLITTDSSLDYREPEGVKVYQTNTTTDDLYLGFASGVAGARKANIYRHRDRR